MYNNTNQRKNKLNFIHALKQGNKEEAIKVIDNINAPKIEGYPIFKSENEGLKWTGWIKFESGERIDFKLMDAEAHKKLSSELSEKYDTVVYSITINRD